MSSNGTSRLFFLPMGKTINGVMYRKMLGDKFEIPTAIHKYKMLMQDGAP